MKLSRVTGVSLKVSRSAPCGLHASAEGGMGTRHREPELPREAITLTTYAQLDLFLRKFVTGELGLVLLLGRHGIGKSESVRNALTSAAGPEQGVPNVPPTLFVEGHMQPFGLYRQLWEHRNRPVVLDDLDRLYADADCVRLLKPLCNTVREKRLHWLTNLTLGEGVVPASFSTTSNVVLIANEWRSLNPNVRALEDRAIILHFCPDNDEVHRQVGQWLNDPDVYDFVGTLMPVVAAVSMRHYCKGSQLRRAGMENWRSHLLQMMLPDNRVACVIAVQNDPRLGSDQQRVVRFMAMTGASRATYYRIKAKLAAST